MNKSCLKNEILISLLNFEQGLMNTCIFPTILLIEKCLLMTRSLSISAQSDMLRIFWKYTLSLSDRVNSILIIIIMYRTIVAPYNPRKICRYSHFFCKARKAKKAKTNPRTIELNKKLHQYSFFWMGFARVKILSFLVFNLISFSSSFQ